MRLNGIWHGGTADNDRNPHAVPDPAVDHPDGREQLSQGQQAPAIAFGVALRSALLSMCTAPGPCAAAHADQRAEVQKTPAWLRSTW
jgi:hypothetical protein